MQRKQTKGPAARSTWDSNKAGPYKVLRRLRGLTTAEEVGRVYAAQRRATGRPALLVAPGGQQPYHPAEEWRLRLRAIAAPRPFLALEVERAPAGTAPVTALAEGLDVLTAALEGLELHPEAALHLAAPPTPRRHARWRGRAPFWAALGTALLVAALLPSTRTPPSEQHPAEAVSVSAAEEALTVPQRLPVGTVEGRVSWVGLALDMPKEPFPGQYRVDRDGKCKGKREVPINGGCWVQLAGKAPCGDDAYDWKGGCYWPSAPSAREPSSTLGPRRPPSPAAPAQ